MEGLDPDGRHGFRREVESLALSYDRVVDRLLTLPVTLLHGQFYPSNIIIQRKRGVLRVCPVDWETTGIGPGLVDLAAITAGWTEPQRLALTEIYFRALNGDEVSRPVSPELIESLDYCRLYTAVHNVGWCNGTWTVASRVAHRSLQDVMGLRRKLGL